jgi:beta-lactamase class A
MLRRLTVITATALLVALTAAPASAAHAGRLLLPSHGKITAKVKRYLKARPGRLSISIKDLTTGFSHTYNPRLRTATASIVKVDILVALLIQAQSAHRKVTAAEKSLAANMIKNSDNAAATALWNRIGGSAGLRRANRKLRLKSTVAGPSGYWGSTTTSAKDQIRILTALTTSRSPLTKKHRRYVLGLMSNVRAGQDWGVGAAGGDVALKNGWLPRVVDGGGWTINSIGRARTRGHDYLIAVISDRHPSMSAGVTTVEQVVTRVTGLIERGDR